jgi:SAM-dependent methyltransferase
MSASGPVHPQKTYAALLADTVRPGIRWLDIGCGGQIVPDWACSLDEQRRMLEGVHLAGLDVDDAIHRHPFLNDRLIGLADDIPAPPDSFDLVTANMVMEHVQYPAAVLNSVHRVLRDGGRFIVHTPNYRFYLTFVASFTPDFVKRPMVSWLERRDEKDIFPTLYRFNTREAIITSAERSGFQVEHFRIIGPYPAFRRVPVVSAIERTITSFLEQPAMERFRSNLLVTLRKPLNP